MQEQLQEFVGSEEAHNVHTFQHSHSHEVTLPSKIQPTAKVQKYPFSLQSPIFMYQHHKFY